MSVVETLKWSRTNEKGLECYFKQKVLILTMSQGSVNKRFLSFFSVLAFSLLDFTGPPLTSSRRKQRSDLMLGLEAIVIVN